VTGHLPQIKNFEVRIGSDGTMTAVWTVTGATDVRLGKTQVSQSGRQVLHVKGATTLVLSATSARGTITQVVLIPAPSTPISVPAPRPKVPLPVIRQFRAENAADAGHLNLVWAVTGVSTVPSPSH
jgi:hypothetical protein